jgi:hypothetical protein
VFAFQGSSSSKKKLGVRYWQKFLRLDKILRRSRSAPGMVIGFTRRPAIPSRMEAVCRDGSVSFLLSTSTGRARIPAAWSNWE